MSIELTPQGRDTLSRTSEQRPPNILNNSAMRSASGGPTLHPSAMSVLQLQKAVGNRAAQQLLLPRMQPIQRLTASACTSDLCTPAVLPSTSPSKPVQMVRYPLKEGDESNNPYSIPETDQSRNTAKEIVAALHQALEEHREVLKAPKLENGERNTAAKKKDWVEGYMIGVLITSSNKVYITCSGSPPADFKSTVSKFGIVINSNIPKDSAAAIIEGELNNAPGARPVKDSANHIHLEQDHEHQEHPEVGAVAGKCAAPKLIWHLIEETKEQPVAMSEILFAPEGKPNVKINDAQGEERSYGDNDIVPSCLTCQSLVTGLLKQLESYRKFQAEAEAWGRKDREQREQREKEYAIQEELEKQQAAAYVKKREAAMAAERLNTGQTKLVALVSEITVKLKDKKYKKNSFAMEVLKDVEGYLALIDIEAKNINEREILVNADLLDQLIKQAKKEQEI
ncbi:hypothetical protein ACFFSY_20350 [Paenibacillus aurantiacus]|uniref:Uncharacterized protein n=1 Tax=Paenibacillus aurantiacus TaxID=1936118 RepID=A0ABV5KSS9_9BACL